MGSIERAIPPLNADERVQHARHNGHADLIRERIDGSAGV
jgi:hypothetical protein